MKVIGLIPSIPADKQGHFIAGVLCYVAAHFLSPIAGLAAVAIMAIAKEIYDYMHRDNHTPEFLDAVATMAGGLAGFICGLTL